MKQVGESVPKLTASDLVGYLHCRHLTDLDRRGLPKEVWQTEKVLDPLLQILSERGAADERSATSITDQFRPGGRQNWARVEGHG